MIRQPLKPITLVLLILFSFIPVYDLQARIDDPAYHHLDEIYGRIVALADSLPDAVLIDTIGYSQLEGLPILAVRIGRDLDEEFDRPVVVINGQVHAEEVLGVEYCMYLIDKLVNRQGNGRNWFNDVETWIVPTFNPEGLNVVFEFDPSWRKNKRDNIGDGGFRWFEGWGNDTSGVDLNRNFPFFWIHGDKFLIHGNREPYDYYRGPSPLSESETQTMDKFYDRIRPVFNIILHSSGTGLVAQRIYYPWGYGLGKYENIKFCPDIDAWDNFARAQAARTQRYGESGKNYIPAPVAIWRGDADSYLYWKYGIFSERIEIGAEAEAMQPDSLGIVEVIEGSRGAMEYMLNVAAGLSEDEWGVVGNTMFGMKVLDESGQPLEAMLTVDSLSTALMPSRFTNPVNGLYSWPVLESFSDSITIQKFGYYSVRGPVSAQVFSTPLRPRYVTLERLPRHAFHLKIVDADQEIIKEDFDLEVRNLNVPSHVGWSNSYVKRIQTPLHQPNTLWNYTVRSGSIRLELPEGLYQFTTVGGESFVPKIQTADVISDTTFSISMLPGFVLLDQNFDDGDVQHTSNNERRANSAAGDSLIRWELTNSISHSPPNCLTDSRLGSTYQNTESWDAPYNLFDTHFDLSDAQSASLVYWLNQALEPGFDSMWVEVSLGGPSGSNPSNWTWTQVSAAHQELAILENVQPIAWNGNAINYMQFHPWQRFVVPLDAYVGNPTVHFRFRLSTDNFLTEDGVYIDDVQLISSANSQPVIAANNNVPTVFKLGLPAPNPFNSSFRITVRLPETGNMNLELFNAGGRLVKTISKNDLQQGDLELLVDMSAMPAGVYILRGNQLNQTDFRKLVLLK